MMRELFGIYLGTDAAKSLALAEQMALANPQDIIWASTLALQRFSSNPNSVTFYREVDQTRTQTVLVQAELALVAQDADDIRTAYEVISKLVASAPAEPLLAEVYKLGYTLKKSGSQIDEEIWRLRYKDAKPFYKFELASYDNRAVKLADMRGKVVMLDFWAPHCLGCTAQFPALSRLVERYRSKTDKFLFLIVDAFPSEDFMVSSVSSFMEHSHFPFTVLKAPGKDHTDHSNWLTEKCGVNFYGSVILDSKGRWIYTVKDVLSEEDLKTVENMIDGLLKNEQN